MSRTNTPALGDLWLEPSTGLKVWDGSAWVSAEKPYVFVEAVLTLLGATDNEITSCWYLMRYWENPSTAAQVISDCRKALETVRESR